MAPDAQDTKEKKRVMLMAEYTGNSFTSIYLRTNLFQIHSFKT